MNAPEKAGVAAARAAAMARGAAVVAAHAAVVERLVDARGAVSTAEVCAALGRTVQSAVTACAALGLRRSDETDARRYGIPVFHARTLDAAIAAERAWLAARASRSPASREPRRLQVRPDKLAPRHAAIATPGAPAALVVLPLADVREPGDVFACSALGARLSAGACVARQRSERIECFVCRDCDDGRAVARRLA